MLFGLIPTRDAPAADPQAGAPPIRESRGGPLGEMCRRALDAIAGAAPARAAAQQAERLSLHPLVARPAPDRRVDPMLASATGRDPATARVFGQAPASIPVMPARSGPARLQDFMPRTLD